MAAIINTVVFKFDQQTFMKFISLMKGEVEIDQKLALDKEVFQQLQMQLRSKQEGTKEGR